MEKRNYCKILILDDEYVMRQGIKHMMEWEKEGFKIVGEASNGEEGLILVEKLRPDIILADIVMPIVDGIAFTSAIKQRYPKIRVIILSSYDKFEYVKQALLSGAVDYVLKPSLSPVILLEVLLKAVKTIPNLHLKKDNELSVTEKLNRYLSGYEAGITEASFKREFPHTRYRLLCANLSVLCGGYKELEHRVYQVVENYFADMNMYIAKVLWIKEEICCVVLNYRIKEEEQVWADVFALIQSVREYEQKTFWIYGEVFSGFSELKNRYLSILPYTGWRFYHKDNAVCKESTLVKKEQTEKFDYEKYTNCLKYQDIKAAISMLQEHVTMLSANAVEEYLLKNITKNLLYNLLIEWDKTEKGQSRKKTMYFQKIDSCIYIEEFQQIFSQIIAELLEESQNAFHQESNISEICQYIRKHYAENLELLQLAKQFNYNYNYLSTYFNQQVKEGFSGYLNRLRVEKACDLLHTTPYTIAQISELVGYSDHSYFCRVFKNLKGRTPSQWRRKIVIK